MSNIRVAVFNTSKSGSLQDLNSFLAQDDITVRSIETHVASEHVSSGGGNYSSSKVGAIYTFVTLTYFVRAPKKSKNQELEKTILKLQDELAVLTSDKEALEKVRVDLEDKVETLNQTIEVISDSWPTEAIQEAVEAAVDEVAPMPELPVSKWSFFGKLSRD